MSQFSNTHKGQEPHAAQTDTVMFAPSHTKESKESEKPRRRTFEDIRAENRKHRMQTYQEQSHVSHDDNTGNDDISNLMFCTILFVKQVNPNQHNPKDVHEQINMVT